MSVLLVLTRQQNEEDLLSSLSSCKVRQEGSRRKKRR